MVLLSFYQDTDARPLEPGKTEAYVYHVDQENVPTVLTQLTPYRAISIAVNDVPMAKKFAK